VEASQRQTLPITVVEREQYIISFMNLFKTRINELRVGHSSYTTKKVDGKTLNVSVSQYGFFAAHHILLEGISLPPEKKAGMAQSLGPLTALIQLAKSDPESKYTRRWRMAVSRNCSFLPEIESIIHCCCGKKASEVREIFNIIADILLMTTSREAKRATFPAYMVINMLKEQEIAHYLSNNTIYIDWFNFSGNGAFQLYNICIDKEWSYPIRSDKTGLLPQIIFHGIWGTFSEDFGILSWMTDQNDWCTRNEMDNAFIKMGESAPFPIKLIRIKKYAKLTSANQTGLLYITSSQITSRSVFSGKTKHIFTDKFFEYMESTHTSSSSVRKNMETVTNILQSTKATLYAQVKEKRTQERGTTTWHYMEGSTKTEYGPEVKEVPSTSGRFFLQSQD